MSFGWYSAALLLHLLTPDLLPTRHLLLQAFPTSSPVTHHKIQYITDAFFDYNYDEEDSSHSPPNQSKNTSAPTTVPKQHKPCEYHPCRDNQAPCSQLSFQTGCLCPGLSSGDMPPHPPHLLELLPGPDGKTKIRWCAPASVVSGYRVVIEHKNNGQHLFRPDSRSGVIGKLEAGVEVCVEAVNMAGNSAPSEHSCQRYNPPGTTNLALWAGVIGGGLGLLLSLTALILWRRQTCRKAQGDPAEGLGNPSYSTEGKLYIIFGLDMVQ
ncbi:hypothetical protein UPYG_G00212020 [Umbra pygmaea]|uniref:LRRN4 C-terminal-like protein n=1 Tax=Umbra pygmaea TaxID=75934 RepID=A0ABD0WJZ0_UMBPY